MQVGQIYNVLKLHRFIAPNSQRRSDKEQVFFYVKYTWNKVIYLVFFFFFRKEK